MLNYTEISYSYKTKKLIPALPQRDYSALDSELQFFNVINNLDIGRRTPTKRMLCFFGSSANELIELYPKKWTTKSCEYGIRKRKGTEKWKNLQKKKKNY